jgi:HrpA-like RNA helicase
VKAELTSLLDPQLLASSEFGCSDEILTIAAMTSVQVSEPFRLRLRSSTEC